MKNTYRFWFLAYLTVFLMVGFFVFVQQNSLAATGINKKINFQGKVVNTNGTNVANASYSFVFTIYDASSAGTNLWTETKSVTVTDGIFQTDLGDTTTLPASIDFNTDNIYLGINFNSDGEMTPRVRFDAVPQAFNAQKVAGLTVTDTTGTLTIPSGKVISFSDAFTTSGAFATTLTATGTTSVTLPTGGTLLTNTATSNQTITSTQTTGTVAGITDSTAITAATTGLAITLSGTGAFDQTGLSFNLTNASGTNLNDILGSGSTWKVSRAGAGTFASLTSSGAIAANGGITFDATTDTIGSYTAGGIILMNSNILQDIGNTGTDFIASTGALTLAGILTANGGISLAGSQSLSGAALSFVDLGLITQGSVANQGLRLPNAASATPSSPTSGEGYLAWDAAGNQLITYNGAAWTTVGGGALTPWTSDIDADGFDLNDLSNILFRETTGAPTGTDVGLYRDNAGDLSANVLTGKTLNIAVNGADEYNFSSTGLAFNSNNITGLGTNLTAGGTLTIASTTTGLTLDSGSGRVSVATEDFLGLSVTGVSGAAAGDIWYDSSAGKFKINEVTGGTKILCNLTDGGCGAGGAVDLQTAYGNDADGSDATIALTSTDGSLIFQNPSSSGTGSEYVAKINQLASGAVDGLQISNAGTGRALNITQSGAATAVQVNATSTGSLFDLQKSGTSKFVVANNGGVSIFGSTTNNTKTNTGTTGTNDFSITGSTLTNVTSQNDEVDIDGGTVVTTFTSATATTSNAVGAGGHSIVRDDGKIINIAGGGAAVGTSGSLWDGTSATMTSIAVATGATAPGAGAISLKRPNGKYLLLHGNTANQLTSIFDPWGISAATGGPSVCANGYTTGTNAFMRPDGKYVILCGGLTNWGIYDPTANTYTAGTAVTLAFGAGAHAVARDDGTFLVFRGGNTTNHWLYTPSGLTGAAGVMSTINPITTNAPTINTGAFSIRRNDGRYLVVGGAINTSTIYNPTPTSSNSGAGSFELINGGTPAAGFGPITTALGGAAQAVRRQDGKYLMVHGGASTLTDIIDPSVTTSSMFTAGTALNNAMGAGGHFVPRPDGKYAIIKGGGTGVDTYDMGFVMGGNGSGSQLASYETECITATSLNQSSTLNWNANAEGTMSFQVKTGTGSCSGAYEDIPTSGGLINPVAGDNRVQVKVFFKRPFFIGYDQEWSLWRGLSQPRYRAKVADPTLYDITVDNSTQVHRTQFDLGIGINSTATDPSGPVNSNINITADKSAQLSTGPGNQGLASTVTAIGATYNGAVGTHNVLLTGAMEGTIVIKRPNNTFMVIAGNSATANAQIYDQNAQTFTANANGVSGSTCSGNCVPTAIAGRGALAFKRPDGKFLIVLGVAATTTNIYDPVASTFTAGPAATGLVGRGALTIPLPNGRVLIVHGNQLTTTSIYDPVQNVMIAGPGTTVFVGPGSLAIPNANGTWFVSLGLAAVAESATAYTCTTIRTTTNMFDPYTMAFTNTTGQPAFTTGTGPGAFAFQRSDGLWMINKGGNVVTTCAVASATAGFQLYNPVTMKLAVGPNSVVAPLSGGHPVQRPNGSWLIINGGGTTTTQIYLENDGAASALAGGVRLGSFTAGPAMTSAVGSGAVSFQRDDGKFVTLSGGTTTTALSSGTVNTNVQQYDAGWVTIGAHRTEQLNVTDLSTDSTISWKASPDMKNISAEVRTATSQLGLQTASSRDVTTSGGLINPGGSDTWAQVQFNFKRTFPTNGNIWADTWWNGGSTSAYTWRSIANPTLNEFKINKDVNLMNLKADGLSVFRVSTNGDVYLSANGAVRSGGADLAENYTSSTPLETGEVVTIDPIDNHNVKRSQYQYQKDMLGVVSTAPGFVAGSQTENSYPIALVGRVPVKVSTENGNIKVGDHITASSVPGYAMRATKAGRVLGITLETLDDTKLHECPASEFASPNRKCGEVEMFVNLVNYMGDSVQVAMEERVQEKQLTGGAIDGLSTGADSVSNVATSGLENPNSTMSILTATGEDAQFSKQQQILTFLNDLKAEQAKSSQYSSEIFTDQLYATNGIVTPQLVADLIIAKRIKADSIEGLSIFTDKIGSLSERVANQGKDVTTQSLTAQDAQIGDLDLESAKVSMNMNVDGKITVGGLVVNDIAVFKNNTVFNKLVSFIGRVVFKSDVAFEKTPIFNNDAAGFARINKGADRVDIIFDTAYNKTPIVQAMMTVSEDKPSISDTSVSKTGDAATSTSADVTGAIPAVLGTVTAADSLAKDALQKQLLAKNYAYFVVNRTKKGFTIILNKSADEDLDFSWVAIAVADAQTFESKKPEPIVSTTSSIPAAVPDTTTLASPILQVTPAITPKTTPITTPAL